MSRFAYTARDAAGTLRRGFHEAESAFAAVGHLREQGLAVVDVRGVEGAGPTLAESFQRMQPSRWLKPSSLDVELSLNQLAVMLRGGLTLLAAIKTVGEQCRRQSMQRIWQEVGRRIQSGSGFAEALHQHRCFPPLVVQLVRVGEQTGVLEPVLRRSADIMERRRTLRNTLMAALAYPGVVLVMAFGVTAFMMIDVIPKLQVFLVSLGRKLPAMTQLLVDISLGMRAWAPQLGLGLLAAIVAATAIMKWPPARFVVDRWSLRLPLIGVIFRLAATALFSRALGMLIRSGVTMLEALRTVEMLHRNRFLRSRVLAARESVLQGGSLSQSLRAPHAYMPMLAAMTTVGESTGTLDDVLDETARFHEEQLQSAIKRFSMMIEPAIVIVVGGVVGFVYISFFMALFAAAGSG